MTTLVEEKLKEIGLIDVALFKHGFMPYMRDYFLEYESGGIAPYAGLYLCLFTHCVVANLETRVGDEIWQNSWSDVYLDFDKWVEAGEPNGFVWGTNWSLTYPGLEYMKESNLATRWSIKLKKEMHEIIIQTESIQIQLIFHDVIVKKLSSDVTVIDKVIFPMK
ncbi:MAG TPA: hypothetical protein VF338_03360 [Leptolinea sp.]